MFDNVLKVISTTSDKLPDIEVKFGQLIFCRDKRVIYFDTDVRTSYEQILILSTENLRQNIIPVTSFYFVVETGILWRFENGEWIQVSKGPKELVVFASFNEFPVVGDEKTIYVDADISYRYLDGEYVAMNSPKWQPF